MNRTSVQFRPEDLKESDSLCLLARLCCRPYFADLEGLVESALPVSRLGSLTRINFDTGFKLWTLVST